MADLIDRNEVLETIFNVMSDNKVVHKHRALNRNIKQIPKADTERHAHWETDKYGRDKCTGCNRYALANLRTTYCPKCGCKMDEVIKCRKK